MPSRLRPSTDYGEAALSQIVRAHSAFVATRRIDVLDVWDAGRHISTSPESIGPEHAIVDIVGSVEHFCSGRLLALDSGVTDTQISTWAKRQREWKRRYKIDFQDRKVFSTWPIVEGYIEARNAIQHGLGRLTGQQLSSRRRPDTLKRLASTMIDLHGTRVVLNQRCVHECKSSSEAFVVALDRAAPLKSCFGGA